MHPSSRSLLFIVLLLAMPLASKRLPPSHTQEPESESTVLPWYTALCAGAHVAHGAQKTLKIYTQLLEARYAYHDASLLATPAHQHAYTRLQRTVACLCALMDVPDQPRLCVGNTRLASANDMSNAIFVSQDVLTHYPYEQQKAFLAHEVAHIKHRDSLLTSIFPLGVYTTVVAAAYLSSYTVKKLGTKLADTVAQYGWKKTAEALDTVQQYTSAALQNPLLTEFVATHITQVYTQAFNHFIERRADLYAAETAEAAKGLIAYFSTLSNTYSTTHPLPSARIAYLLPYVQ